MRWLQTWFRAPLAAMIVSLIAAPAFAANVMLLIDGSGSAAGRIGGTTKLDIARQSLSAILAGAPSDLAIGIAAYGHRQRETCSDYEVLAPPGPVPAAIAAAGRIAPLGRSPIAMATVAAAEALGDRPNATIIVITDNADNCAPDPCAIISALHQRMPNLVISVVGIAIPEAEVAAIACFAELTGGLYLRATQAPAFRANLTEALQAAWTDRAPPPPPPPPPPPMPTARLSIPDQIVQGTPFAVTYAGPLDPRDEIRISWYGTRPAEHLVGALIRADGSPVFLTAPAERGAYELRYWHAARGAVIASSRLVVGAIAPALTAPETVQQGAPIVVTWETEARGGETIQLAEPFAPVDQFLATAEARRTVDQITLTAPGRLGRYEIRLVLAPTALPVATEIRGNAEDRILARRAIEVIPAAVTMQPRGPVTAGARFGVAWTGPGGDRDDILLARPGMAPTEAIAAEHPVGDSVRFLAPFPAGRYELRYWSAAVAAVVATVPIDVTLPVATLDAAAELMGGARLMIAWTGPGAIGDRIILVPRAPAGARPVASTAPSAFGLPAVFDAPTAPGDYELRYLAGPDGIVIARRPLRVTGPVVELTVAGPLAAGALFEVRWEGPAGRFDEVRISTLVAAADAPLAAVRVSAGSAAQLRAPAEPGVYLLSYWAGSSRTVLRSISISVVCATCAVAPPAVDGALRP